MAITIYAVLLTCSVTLCIFGFFVGRCARKIPILDEHLPRALHRGESPPRDCQSCKESAEDSAKDAEDALCSRGHASNHYRSSPGLPCDPSVAVAAAFAGEGNAFSTIKLNLP